VTGKDEAIRSAERTLAVRLPEDYASWLRTNDGLERDLGGSYLSLYAVDELVELNHDYALAELMPGLILICTDGGGEGIGLDVRGESSPVVLVNLSSLRWDDASGASLASTVTEPLHSGCRERRRGMTDTFGRPQRLPPGPASSKN
jgi:hypothetical protein